MAMVAKLVLLVAARLLQFNNHRMIYFKGLKFNYV